MARIQSVKLSVRKSAESSVASIIEEKIEALNKSIQATQDEIENVKKDYPDSWENEWAFLWRKESIDRDKCELEIWDGLLSDI